MKKDFGNHKLNGSVSWLWFKYDPTYINIYSQKRGYCKGAIQEEVKEEVKEETTAEVKTVKEPPGSPKQKPTKTITNITDDIANTHIKEKHWNRNKSFKKWESYENQGEQMNARSLLKNAF